MGKTFLNLGWKTVLTGGLLSSLTFSQPLRCDLIQSNTTCFDIDTLQGKTITLPSNVTRLENEGLQLCQANSVAGGDADIVYAYDNSATMGSDYAYVNGPDTTYYFGTGGCASSNTTGTVTFQYWNSAGTAMVARTVPQLVSITGCSQFSEDPFNARGRAIRLAIQNQAARAPQSMAGLLSFTDSVQNIRRPLLLNTGTNITNLLASLNVASAGITDFKPPLDSGRNWLRTASITPQTPGRSKAIVLLSQGNPVNAGYLPLDGTTPPIYAIALRTDTIGTGKFSGLSVLTGGQFFLIPPNRPDSLVSVIDRILNIILVQFTPASFSITNVTNSQTSVGTLTPSRVNGFSFWKITLDQVVGLNSGANNLVINQSFLEVRNGVVTDTLRDTTSFNLGTTGSSATGYQTIPNTTFATRCYAPSQIQWQTKAGVRPAYFTEADSQDIRLRLRTAASDSDLAATTARTATIRMTPDAENATLTQTVRAADSTIFILNPVPMRLSVAATAGNLVLEPFSTDSLVANWVHLRDARDFARDTISMLPTDSMGPVLVSAVKYPYNGPPDSQGVYPPDTLVIKVSEPLRILQGSFNNAFTFSTASNCSDTSVTRLPISNSLVIPVGDTVFTLIVPDVPGGTSPLVNMCVFLEQGGRVTDRAGNLPGHYGISLGGQNAIRIIISVIPSKGQLTKKIVANGYDLKGRRRSTLNAILKAGKTPKALLVH